MELEIKTDLLRLDLTQVLLGLWMKSLAEAVLAIRPGRRLTCLPK